MYVYASISYLEVRLGQLKSKIRSDCRGMIRGWLGRCAMLGLRIEFLLRNLGLNLI